MKWKHLCPIIILLHIMGCSGGGINLFKDKSERAIYWEKLEKAGLSESAIATTWQMEGLNALADAQNLEIPFELIGTFKAKTINARAWSFDLERGQTVEILVQWPYPEKLFIDLFNINNLSKPSLSVIADSSFKKFEADRSGKYIIRLQPELFAEGTYRLSVQETTTYAVFPVSGKDNAAILSFWGADRDGGSRKHEGIDIFAPKGTPVVAPVKGLISSVREGGLGGKQVWLRDQKRGISLYFAHLDSQAVSGFDRVDEGDTIGFVGNTGNARFTKPHLHLGAYKNGAFNPLFLVNTVFEQADSARLFPSDLAAVAAGRANFRSGPATSFETEKTLSQGEVLFVDAALQDWVQVRNINADRGYIHRSLLKPAETDTLELTGERWVYPPYTRKDSLLINTANFEKLGVDGIYTVVIDADRNIYRIKLKKLMTW